VEFPIGVAMVWGDDPASWDEDPEGPSEEDRRRFSGETLDCSECGREMHDESISCPHCGHWMEGDAAAASRRGPGTGVIGVGMAVVIGLGGLLWWLLRP
jgi:hypothetical protein